MSDGVDELIKRSALPEQVRAVFARSGDLRLSAAAHHALLDADALLEAARQEADTLRKAARHEGLVDGLREAARLLEALERHREQVAREAQRDIARLAMAAARKLLGRALRDDPDALADLVEQALVEARTARRLKVLVGPLPAPALESARARLEAQAAGALWVLEVDPELDPGDCVIETDVGRIDARLERQLEALLDALTRRRSHEDDPA
jgi:type III secretion protein L